MSASSSREFIYGSLKHVVSLYNGRERVARVLFRETEWALADECLTAASGIDTRDEWEVIMFCGEWAARRAAAEEVRGGGKREYRPRRVWHTEQTP